MSTRRGERRVFKPPGRIGDDNDLPPVPAAQQSAKWKTDLFKPGQADETNFDALLQGSTSTAQMKVEMGPSSTLSAGLNSSYDDALSRKPAAVENLARDATRSSMVSTTAAQSDSPEAKLLRRKLSKEKKREKKEKDKSLAYHALPQSFDTMDSVALSSRSISTASTQDSSIRQMDLTLTSSLDKKKKKEKKAKKTKKIAWSNEVFVLEAEPLLGEAPPEPDPQAEKLRVSNKDLPPMSKDIDRKASLAQRQSVRIANKEKLTTRWNWNQELVAKDFRTYKKMLAEEDELLPNPDEFDSFQDLAENEHHKVLSAMLEDGELNEREIAAFFEGLALYDVKVKSLQSQLKSIKSEKRAEDSRVLARHSVQATSHQNLLKAHFPHKHPNSPPSLSEAAESDHNPRSLSKSRSEAVLTSNPRGFMQKSLRAMSIRKIHDDNKDDTEVQRLLVELEEAEKKQKKLEKQLQQAGLVIAEDIPYDEAKSNVERIGKRMQEIGSSEVKHEDKEEEKRLREEYFRLEQDMDKFNTALVLSDEWIEEQEELEQKWEDDNAAGNMDALKKVRRYMAVNVKSLSEAQLCNDETPNGQYLPKIIAKKFKRTNVLQLVRTNPEDIVRMHPSTLENLRVTGLTLTERRSIYAHLKDIGPRWKAMSAEPMTERKWTWYKMMKQNFKENLGSYQRHVEQYGPPGAHPYASRENPNEGCPLLGKQCPLKADKLIDYDGDYGYTDEAEYEFSSVTKADTEDPGAKAMREATELTREKKAGERGDILKQHYKGKVLQVSLASGSCESMDESMDRMDFLRHKWIEGRLTSGGEVTDDRRRTTLAAFSDALNELKLSLLGFADRSGMQLTGKKDSNADQPDIRSPIELGLSEEVCETCFDFFEDIDDSMKEMNAKDSRLKSTIEQLRELLDELHERNIATLTELGAERPERSRKLKSSAEIKREIKKSLLAKEPPAEETEEGERHGPPAGAVGGRGGLMTALAGRGRGGRGGGGDLMSAIAGRGRGGRGGGGGDLMSAIAGRGRGGGGGGDLMSAIAGRGRGGRGGGGGGGDLMSAIAGRGRGGRGRGGGDLMSAIAARGRGGRGGGGGGGDLMAAIAARGRGGRGRGGGDLMAAIAARGSSGDRGNLTTASAGGGDGGG